MALLPPGFLPLPVASLYLIGCILEEVSNRDPDEEMIPGLGMAIRPFARRRPSQLRAPNGLQRRVQVHSLVVDDVHPIPPTAALPWDLYETAVSISFRDENGRAFYRGPGREPAEGLDEDDVIVSSPSVDRLSLILKRPVAECLSPERIRQNLNSTGLVRAFAPVPDDLEISISPIEEMAVARYRQALALGHLQAYVADEDCRTALIPASYAGF